MMPFTDEQIQEEIAKQLQKIGVSDQRSLIDLVLKDIKGFWAQYPSITPPKNRSKIVNG